MTRLGKDQDARSEFPIRKSSTGFVYNLTDLHLRNQSTLGGPFVQDLFLDAFQCEESYKAAERQWSDWPIVATDGDLAALLQMVSDHEASPFTF